MVPSLWLAFEVSQQSHNTQVCGLCVILPCGNISVGPEFGQNDALLALKFQSRYNSCLAGPYEAAPKGGADLRGFRPTIRSERMTEAGELEALVSQQIVTAMKAHDAERTGTLRLIKNALKNKAIEKRAAADSGRERAGAGHDDQAAARLDRSVCQGQPARPGRQGTGRNRGHRGVSA